MMAKLTSLTPSSLSLVPGYRGGSLNSDGHSPEGSVVSPTSFQSPVNELASRNVSSKLVTLDVSQFDTPSPVNDLALLNVLDKSVTLDVSQFDTPSPVNEVVPQNV